jgi:hypothetical protein
VYYKEETLFEQYPLELTDTYKGRGAVFAMTDIGRVYLKEYSGSAVKAEFLAKLLECVNEQGIHTETVVRTTEGECLAKDPDGVSYLLRKWCEGRECNTASWDEILRSADILASLHGAMNQMEHSLTGYGCRTTVAYIREAYQRASDGQKLYQRAEKQERI